jgi:hypothetical protein
MNRSWFGPKNESGGGTGIASWQGALVLVVCFGGIIAARLFLTGAIKNWVSGGLMLTLLAIWWATYDKDAIT